MRFYAIMIDSYREAVSGWVLQALMAFSAILMLFVLSISFRQLSPEESITRRFNLQTRLFKDDANLGKPKIGVENFVQTNAPEPYWKGDYKFDMTLTNPTVEDRKKTKETGLPTDEASFRDAIEQIAPYFENVTTRTIPDTPPEEVRVEFKTKGTSIDDPLAWQTEPKVFFAVETGQIFWMSLRQGVYRIEKTIVNDFGAWAAMLVSIIVTAGFIPNMLRKGAMDLYIAKPISHIQLLLYKYVGGLLFVLILASFTIGGIWVVVGIKTGVWSLNFLMTIPIMTFYFAILYSISTLVAVLTRSTLVAILATVVVWGLVFGIGLGHEYVEESNAQAKKQYIKFKKSQGSEGVSPEEAKQFQPIEEWKEDLLYGIRKTLPRTYDTDKLSGRLIAKGVLTDKELKDKGYDEPPTSDWPEVLIVSFLQISLFLGLACWRFVTRDG